MTKLINVTKVIIKLKFISQHIHFRHKGQNQISFDKVLNTC